MIKVTEQNFVSESYMSLYNGTGYFRHSKTLKNLIVYGFNFRKQSKQYISSKNSSIV